MCYRLNKRTQWAEKSYDIPVKWITKAEDPKVWGTKEM